MWSCIVRENAVDEEAFVLVPRQTQLKTNFDIRSWFSAILYMNDFQY